MKLLLNARCMVEGDAIGGALVSRKAFTFAHGVDPVTGTVTDVRSDIRGENVKGKVLIYPYGKGSTTASAWFLETVRLGNGPAAVITGSPDPGVVIGSVLAKILYGKSIPVMTSVPQEAYGIPPGEKVEVNCREGRISVGQY